MRRRVVVVVVLAVFVLLPGTASAQTAPSIALDPAAQVVGGDVAVVGRDSPLLCLDPVARVEVRLGDRVVADAPVGLDGGFRTTFAVPAVAAGPHVVTASCRLLRIGPPVATASATLEVLPSAAPGPGAADVPATTAPPAASPDPSATPPSPPPTAGPTAVPVAGGDGGGVDIGTARVPERDATTTGDARASAAPGAVVAGSGEGRSGDPFARGRRDDVPDPLRRLVGRRGAPRVGVGAPWQVGSSVPLLSEATVTAEGVLAAVLLTAVFALLVGFPNVLVNGAFRSNYDAIVAGARRRAPRLHDVGEAVTSRVAIAPLLLVAVAGAVAATYLDPTAGLDRRSAAVVTGLTMVIGGTCWCAWQPARRRSEGLGNVGRYRAFPVALLLAFGCVLLSRALDFQPGYLYGLLFAYHLQGRWTTRDDGLATLAGFSIVLAMGFVGWALMPMTHALAAGGAWWALVVDTVAVGLTVVGIEAVVLGMLPFTFTPGLALWTWSRTAFVALYGTGFVAFVALLSGQDRSLLVGSGDVGAAAAAAFLAYGAASVGFWGWWRRRRASEDAAAAADVDEQSDETRALVHSGTASDA